MSSNIDGMSKCAICKKVPEDVALQCEQHHAICRRCVPIIEEADDVVKSADCTICQQKLINPGATDHTYIDPFKNFEDILPLVDSSKKVCQVAEGHNKKRSAEYHCSDCDIHLCESCIEVHIPTARDAAKHRLFTIKETESKMSALKCSNCLGVGTHFCPQADCQRILCEACTKHGHQDHNVLTIQFALKYLEESIEKHRVEMNRRGESLAQRGRGMDMLRLETEREVDKVLSRIRENASRIRAIIDHDEAELCRQVTGIREKTEAMFGAVLRDIELNVNKFGLLDQLHSKLKECEKSAMKTVSVFSFMMANDLTAGAHGTDSVLSQLHSHQPYDWNYKSNPEFELLMDRLSNRKSNLFGELSRRKTLEEISSLELKADSHNQVTGMANSEGGELAISDRYTGIVSIYKVNHTDKRIYHIRNIHVPAVAAANGTEIQDVAFRPGGNILVTNFPAGVVQEIMPGGDTVKDFRLTWPKTTWSPLGICVNRRNEVAITFIGTCGVSSKKGFSIHVMDWDTSKVTRSRSLDFSPRYICPLDDGGYAVSDYISRSVYFLKPNLKVRYVYPGSAGLKCPSGMCCLPNGNILIAEKENCTVHEVSPSGNYRKVVLSSRDGLRAPRALTCTSGGDIVIADERGELIKAYKYHTMGRIDMA